MESAKKTKKKSSKVDPSAKIRSGYMDFVLDKGKKPESVYKLCKVLGIKEGEFYQYYASFKALEKSIWKEYASGTIERIKADSNYAMFNSRERVLAFYFTLLERLLEDRSFVTQQLGKWKSPAYPPPFVRKFKKEFDAWAQEVIAEGLSQGEIAKRPFLDKRYGDLLWFHLQFVLMFWYKDSSAGFEKTDEAIEKSVNLAFDIIGKGVLDNALDFGKFLFQQSRN
ncbi:MAG: TetR family transcriptional regulator C-terminal domain-containing protein [Cyclobacteriaceae bacterium]